MFEADLNAPLPGEDVAVIATPEDVAAENEAITAIMGMRQQVEGR